MPDEMEQIEARLAAYIDGMLPPDQQAEIETYLKANPTHGRLIVELKSIKNAVTTLPREKAPAEVLDTLQAHLERHTLLEGVEDTAMSSRINRWPQLGAVAAMLLLTTGLGFLVYQVLPRGGRGSSELAMLTATRPAENETFGDESLGAMAGVGTGGGGAGGVDSLTANRATTESPTTHPAAAADAAARRDRTADVVAASPPPMSPARMMRSAIPAEPAGAKAEAIAANTPAEKRSGADGDSSASPALADAVRVLVVTSDDPALTRNVLVASLAAEGTPFEVTLPPGTPAVPVLPDKMKPMFDSMAENAGRGAGPATAPTSATLKDDSSPSQAAVISTTGWTVAVLASRLQAAGDLPADAVAESPIPGENVRPVIVRNVTPNQATALRVALDHQRPGRQTVREQAGPVRRVLPTTVPATTPAGVAAEVSAAPGAPSTSRFQFAAAVRTSDAARGPSTMHSTTASTASTPPASDLVVFIVAAPPTTRPVADMFAIPPATRPSTARAVDDAP